ncbi:MAG: hypothetical protein ACPL3Q_06610, partial [Candidatus Ratteibacteria bacterium]
VILLLAFILVGGCGRKDTGTIEEKAKQTGAKTLEKLKATVHQDNLLYLKNKINTYKRQNGKYPDLLQQLVNEGFIDKIPDAPSGMQYQYNPSTGQLTLK